MPTAPDRVVAASSDPVGDIALPEDYSFNLTALESRAETDSLSALHHRRRVVMRQLAPLKALHGSFGKWDARRKHLLAAIALRVRARLEAKGGKVTDAIIDAEAHADPQYERVIDQGIAEAAEYFRLQTELDEIEERIRSREIALQAYNAELRLQR